MPKPAVSTAFVALCEAQGLGRPIPEYAFAKEAMGRAWRFDWAFPSPNGERGGLAVEQQGGLFVRGRHTQGAALRKEYAKLNAAAALGWRVLFVLPEQMASGEVFDLIREALKGQGAA